MGVVAAEDVSGGESDCLGIRSWLRLKRVKIPKEEVWVTAGASTAEIAIAARDYFSVGGARLNRGWCVQPPRSSLLQYVRGAVRPPAAACGEGRRLRPEPVSTQAAKLGKTGHRTLGELCVQAIGTIRQRRSTLFR